MKQTNLTDEQLTKMCELVNQTSGLVKTTVGTGNNAAWMACLDALDQIRKHPRYRRGLKGGGTVKSEFKHCFDMLKAYERQLLFSDENRFFHVADMEPETRKIYGPDFTDRQYYDFWAAFGFKAYQSTKPFFTSLVNKLRLAYLGHGVPYPDIMGWASAAECALDIAVKIWESAIRSCDTLQQQCTHLNIREEQWRYLYKDFNLKAVADYWERSVNDLAGVPPTFQLTETEHRNIQAGYDQLAEMWLDADTLFGSRIETAQDFAEIFRTNGEMKKAMRSFGEMRDRIENS